MMSRKVDGGGGLPVVVVVVVVVVAVRSFVRSFVRAPIAPLLDDSVGRERRAATAGGEGGGVGSNRRWATIAWRPDGRLGAPLRSRRFIRRARRQRDDDGGGSDVDLSTGHGRQIDYRRVDDDRPTGGPGWTVDFAPARTTGEMRSMCSSSFVPHSDRAAPR